jgi:hypothetical protein
MATRRSNYSRGTMATRRSNYSRGTMATRRSQRIANRVAKRKAEQEWYVFLVSFTHIEHSCTLIPWYAILYTVLLLVLWNRMHYLWRTSTVALSNEKACCLDWSNISYFCNLKKYLSIIIITCIANEPHMWGEHLIILTYHLQIHDIYWWCVWLVYYNIRLSKISCRFVDN